MTDPFVDQLADLCRRHVKLAGRMRSGSTAQVIDRASFAAEVGP
jgi:hypothetical protein